MAPCRKVKPASHAVTARVKLHNTDQNRRRLKNLRDPAYTVEESQRAAGLGVDNKQRGVEDLSKRVEGMETDEPAAKA